MKHMLSVLRWLSLDVVAGGVLFTMAIAKAGNIDLHWSIPASLGCCIWLIYTLDHLIDGNSLNGAPSLERHAFHRKHRRPIFLLFVIVACAGLRLLFFIPYQTLIYGCVLLGLVGLYFLSIWLFKIYFAKEIFIAVLYSCGVFLGSLSNHVSLDTPIYFLFGQTVLMASLNLLLFSYYEVSQDTQDGHRSWVTHFGAANSLNHLKWLFILLGLTISACFCFNLSGHQLVLQIVFIFMALVLMMIYMLPDWFKQKERFRWIGDLVFVFPGLIFLF